MKSILEPLRGFFAYHRKAETAPRWTCAECQFESSAYGRSHHSDCSHHLGPTFNNAEDFIAWLNSKDSDGR